MGEIARIHIKTICGGFFTPEREVVSTLEEVAQQAEQEKQCANQEKQSSDRLTAKLRELNIDPDTI